MALDENKHDHLVELGGSDFEIVDGEPNIKGWDVKNELGELIGEVDELLFDPQSRQVRYLVVDLDRNLGLDTDKKILVPIGVAELYKDGYAQDEDDTTDRDLHIERYAGVDNDSDYTAEGVYNPADDGKEVIIPVTTQQLAELPSYKKGHVSPETESIVRNVFSGLGTADLAGTIAYNREDFYTHDHFNENKFYERGNLPVRDENLEIEKQQVKTNEAPITSRIVERPVKETINLHEEHGNVERTSVNRGVDPSDNSVFQEKELEPNERAEVPVTDKRGTVIKEVYIKKDREEDEIDETLGNTKDTERNNPDRTKLS
jgi:stress response protein YsnF